jgi:hypothetical protein
VRGRTLEFDKPVSMRMAQKVAKRWADYSQVGAKGTIKRVVPNGAVTWALRCASSLRALLKQEHVRVSLGET